MYLRPHRRVKNGAIYEYWSLVKSVRTPRGPRQRTVAIIGKEPGLDRRARVGWEHIGVILDGGVSAGRHTLRGGGARQLNLFETSQPQPDAPCWATIDLSRVRVERERQFGAPYLGLALWRRLGLDKFFSSAIEPGREEIPWPVMACLLTLARFCAPSSELQIAESWYAKTALDDLLGVPIDKVNDDRLYRGLDAALPCRDGMFAHLQERYGQWFGTQFDILLYDITSTYFEGQMKSNPGAKRGYSRDGRPDCLQVCIGLIVTPEGLPLAYEVFDGNRSDVTTVEQIVETMRTKYGHERRVWVMDRGMVSEKVLTKLRESNARYLVGTPKSMLKVFEHEMNDDGWTTLENGVQVKLCAAPENLGDTSGDTFVLCRAPGRIEKERAMRQRQIEKLDAALRKLQQSAATKRLRDRGQAERRVGRLMQRFTRAARTFAVTITERTDPKNSIKTILDVAVERRDEPLRWAEKADGYYLLRTNLDETDPAKLWQMYIGLTQVEYSFRVTKTDHLLRPIYHRHEDRTQAHILICFLALTMWRALEHWMKASGLGDCPRKLIEELNEVHSMDIVLPTQAGPEVRLRVVARPEQRLAILLDRLDLPLPNRPKFIQNVVQKTGLLKT